MASLDELQRQRVSPEAEQEAMEEIPVDEDQVELVTRLAVQMLQEGGGLDMLDRALQQSEDPAQVVGQFLVQLIGALADNLSQEMDLDPRIFLAKGGFVDHILDYIEVQLNLPKEFSDQVYQEVIEMIRGLAQGETKPAQGAAPAGPVPGATGPGAVPQSGVAPMGLDMMGMGG